MAACLACGSTRWRSWRAAEDPTVPYVTTENDRKFLTSLKIATEPAARSTGSKVG
jgi:hypothetical protein